jgi:ferric-dicitrate binding protein FerR (iron transport regulator)
MNNKDLLKRYIDKTATNEERIEFLKRVRAGEYDDDQMDDDVREAIKAEQTTTFAGQQQLIDNSRAELLSRIDPKIVPLEKRERSRWLAAASLIAIALVAVLWMYSKGVFSPDKLISQNETTAPKEYTGKQMISLPDGSTVVLNEGSKFSYSTDAFGTKSREVFLEGEGYFDVQHNPEAPFIVHTGRVNTKVLGTAFNVKAYPGQEEIVVTVARGLVQVGDDEEHIYDKISPDEQIIVDVASNEFVKKNTDAKEALAWQNNFLILHDVDMEEAAKIIGEKFNVQITLENEALKKCRIDGTFLNDEGLNEVLGLIGEVLNIKFTVEKNGNVILRGKGCK